MNDASKLTVPESTTSSAKAPAPLNEATTTLNSTPFDKNPAVAIQQQQHNEVE